MKYTLYTYDLWADQSNCNDCASPRVDDIGCMECKSKDIHTSYSVNDVYRGETIEADTFEDALSQFELKMDMIEMDNNVCNDDTAYFNYIKGEYSGSPACEIRSDQK